MSELNGRKYSSQDKIAVTFLILLFAAVAVRTAWLCDDAFISFRVVDNFVNGYGLVWNTAERVQVFTNPLWVLVISLLYYFTSEIYFTSIFLSILLTIISLIIISFRLSGTLLAIILAITVLTLSKSFTDYTTSGLENPMTYLLITLFYWQFLKSRNVFADFLKLCFIASLMSLNRMDTVLFCIPALTYSFLKMPWKTGIYASLIGFSPFIVWELFAVIYYGFALPNTFYAKLQNGVPASELIVQGIVYYLDSLNLDPITLLMIGFGIVTAIYTRRTKEIFLAAGLVLYLLYIVRIGGDFMSGRFFAVPLLGSVMLFVASGYIRHRNHFLICLVIFILVGISAPRSPLFSDKRYGLDLKEAPTAQGIVDERAFYYRKTGLLLVGLRNGFENHSWYISGRIFAESGSKLKEIYSVGLFGFAAGPHVHIIDLNGLCDPLLSRLPAQYLERWRIGHFGRISPRGYSESILSSKNLIQNEFLSEYYGKLHKITSGDVFDGERIAAIWNFNLGRYDHLVQKYMKSPLVVNYREINTPKATGTLWNDESNIVLGPSGLKIVLDSVSHSELIEFSVDNNDIYRIQLLHDSIIVYEGLIKAYRIPGGGLRIDTIVVDPEAASLGYNVLTIQAGDGDGKFSVGHVKIIDENDGL